MVFNTAPVDGSEVVIERVTSLDRSINYQTYNNSFRPETLNYDLDRIWRVLQEDHITDANIIARIKDEIEWRRTHDTEWDLLAQTREKGLFNALKSYMDAIGVMSVPNLFDGITDNVVITEEGVSQRVTNRDLKKAQAELQNALDNLDGTVGTNLGKAKAYTDIEMNRAIAAEAAINTSISNVSASVTNEKNRAIAAEDSVRLLAQSISGGYLTSKDTLAELQAVTGTVGQVAKVMNDGSNSGDYRHNGTTWVKGYNAEEAVKTWANTNALFNPITLPTNSNVNNLDSGLYFISSDSVAATITGLPPQLTQPRRGFIFCLRRGTTSYQRFVRDYSTKTEAYERTGNGQSVGGADFAWFDWKAANPESALDTFKASNELLTPKSLTSGADLNTLGYGIYLVPSTAVASSILNAPADMTAPKIGIVYSYNVSLAVKYQRFVRYTEVTNSVEIFERVTNGGSSNNLWTEWRKQLTSKDISGFAALNLFPSPRFGTQGTAYFQATTSVEDGFTVLNMNPGFTYVFYDMDISNSEYIKAGDTVSFSAEIHSDGTSLINGGDISIECYASASSSSKIGSTFTDTNEIANAWQVLTIGTTIPEGTNRLRLRLINRGGTNTYCKFKKPKLTSSSWYATNITTGNSNSGSSSVSSLNIFVAKSGSDVNSGTHSAPYETIQKAVNAIGDSNGIITVLDSEWYREKIDISSKGSITLQSARNQRAKIIRI